MCAVFLAAVRHTLPKAQAPVGLFPVVQLAVKAAADARRQATATSTAAREGEGDPEYGIKGPAPAQPGEPCPAQFTRIIETLDADGRGRRIALTWIAKDKLRAALNLRMSPAGHSRGSAR